jgi:hypothetical protein
MQFDVDAALQELDKKSYQDIQKETAIKWGSRAIAAYLISEKSEEPSESLHWLEMGNEYAHESIEHAALVEDSGALVGEIGSILSESKHAAIVSLMGEEDDQENTTQVNEDLVSDSAEADGSGNDPSDQERS